MANKLAPDYNPNKGKWVTEAFYSSNVSNLSIQVNNFLENCMDEIISVQFLAAYDGVDINHIAYVVYKVV